MITEKELNETTLSPTKKDYYQIWNELMELAEKISERWSPASTNESDPGIVLLKALTAVADKLNYNIDKNTLEAFMPSATQEDSMRKLTEMMGYDMKHYRSATGKAVITYKSSNETSIKEFSQGIYFPKFINLKNEDEDINYITLEEFTLQDGQDSREIAVIEGEILECETNNDNIITSLHLDDLNRYTLPEYAIAENGIFITNIADSKESDLWRREQNLNVQQPGSKVYKVGFDSALQLPYVQFPEDVKTLMEDGLRIKYVRTNGINGNISAKVLSKLEKPGLWSTADDSKIKDLSVDAFAITNNSAASNGADPETLNAAYNNYKKTIGTFDTLVTCRDYMNKIYQMTESDTDTTPLVSNIVVSDIRDDINRSTPVCTFNEYGICYADRSLKDNTEDIIEHFDLICYPFKTIYGLNNKTEYKNSFKYTAENMQKIQSELALNKTIAHNITTPIDTEIASIKNYLKLKARITTTKKVTYSEEAEILNNIYKAIYANFNARQVEFGEEIPYDSILNVIKAADYRIKDVNLDEPLLNTKLCLADRDNTELSITEKNKSEGDRLYNKLALRNVLAGKISAFEYNNDFLAEYDKAAYPTTNTDGTALDTVYSPTYPATATAAKIKSIESSFDAGTAYVNRDTTKEPDGLVLKENEVIQFRVPNFKTVKTYPAYVNYYIHLDSTTGEGALPATFESLGNYMAAEKWQNLIDTKERIKARLTKEVALADVTAFNTAYTNRGVLFTLSESTYTVASSYAADTDYYYLPINDDIFAEFNSWVKTQDSLQPIESPATGYKKLKGIYRTTGVQEKPFGKLIDIDLKKYLPANKFGSVSGNKEVLDNFYIQVTRAADEDGIGTADGFGRDAKYVGIPKDGEYELKAEKGEYLLINYTDSKTDESGTETKTVINKKYVSTPSKPIIIRANFNLIDSALYNQNHTFSKRDGFTFEGHSNLDGMFTLGTNEQIEIREVVKVDLKEETMYLYWDLNSDNPEKESNKFIFEEDYCLDLDDDRSDGTYTWTEPDENGITVPAHNAYTLKEGEHLYYTNSKKQDLVYYGAGTIIVRSSPNINLTKLSSNGEVSEEEIMTNGLAAAIPWVTCTLNSSDKRLEVIENQYISLTEGDTIISVEDAELTPNDLTNNWRSLDRQKDSTYRFAEDEGESTLPRVVVSGIQWGVRSRLDFNMSKATAQPLNAGDFLTITFADNDYKTLRAQMVDGSLMPMYVNSNYTCQAATDTIKVADSLDLKLKISSKDAPQVSVNNDLLLNNYVNGSAKYTKFNFSTLPKTHDPEDAAFKLNINIPPDSFGLVTMYYIKDENEAVNTGAYLQATGGNLELFNADQTPDTTLTLVPGINVIKIGQTVTKLEVYSDEAKKSTIIFGGLDLIKGINPKLDYRNMSQGGGATDADLSFNQLLADIKASKIADDFYYNVPIQRSNEIDLNELIDTDLLSSPTSWYDTNNVNRKFVISEIDADYLATGITLAKTSRA